MKLSYNRDQVKNIAGVLIQHFAEVKVWAFYGEMGAGKTTLIHAICELLQVKDAVSSPTFSIINEYRAATGEEIYHMDWYRLRDEEEAEKAGVEDCILSGKRCLIEWPEKAAGLLPDQYLHIDISLADSNNRILEAYITA